MANPKRHPWGNRTDILNHYRRDFIANWVFGAMLCWPAAVLVGRRAQAYQGGVAVVPYQRFVHDWPRMAIGKTTTYYFRKWAFGTAAAFGFCYAMKMTDDSAFGNMHYNRPDLKPFPAMVKDKGYDEVAYEQLMDQTHPRTDKKTGYKRWAGVSDEIAKSSWYRLFFPLDADFNLKNNLYTGRDSSTNFNAKLGGGFPSVHNNYKEHENF